MKAGLAVFGILGVSGWAVCSLATQAIFRLSTYGEFGITSEMMVVTAILGFVGTLSLWAGGVAIGLAAMARDSSSPAMPPGKPY